MMHRRLLHILLLTTALTAPAVTPVKADPISIAILTTVGVSAEVAVAGSFIVAATTFALTTAAGIGLSLLSNALTKKKTTPDASPTTSGADLNVQYGGALPRMAVLGLRGVGGQLVYVNTYGDTNTYLQCVHQLGDGWSDGINRMWVNGTLVTLVEQGDGASIGGLVADELRDNNGNPLFFVRFFDGNPDQEADAELVNNANPAGRWASTARGRGCCYVSTTQVYNEDAQLTGIPDILVELRGVRCYDPRLDSTNGGSGDQRYGSPETYAWSDNVAVLEYNFRRGIRVNGQVLVGMDTVSAIDLITPMYIAAANDCDDDIPLAEGGTEKRYRAGLTASSDSAHSETLEALRQAMAGFTLERAGQFGPIAGVSQDISFEFSDSDFRVGAKATRSKYDTRSNIATAMYGTFSDPAQAWQSVPLPARVNTDDDAVIGERLARSIDLPQIYSNSQGQRVLEIERRRSMRMKNGTSPLCADFLGVQPGDWGIYHSPWGDVTVQAGGVKLNPDLSVDLTWREIDGGVFTWTTAGELPAPGVPVRGNPGNRVSAVLAFAATGAQITASGGLVIPALRAAWTAIIDPTIARVDIEYRVQGSTDALTFVADVPSAGEAVISGSVQADTVYELRARPVALPDRATEWTDWITATSGSNQVVKRSQTVDLTDYESFSAALKDTFTRTIGTLTDRLTAVEAQIVAPVANDLARNWLDKTSVRDELSARTGAAFAEIAHVSSVATAADAAFASELTTITAAVDDHTASISANAIAIANLDGVVTTRYTVVLDSDGYAIDMELINGGPGLGFVGFRTDNFFIALPGGDGRTIFANGLVNGVPTLTLAGDLIADGYIKAQHIEVADFRAISSHFGSGTFDGLLTATGGKLEIDFFAGGITGFR